MKKLLYVFLAVSLILTACKKEEDKGCTDVIATNYNPTATVDDGSCTYGLVGGAWITTSITVDIHMTVILGGMTLMDSSWTDFENDPDSLEPYKLKFIDDGTYTEYDQSGSIVESGSWTQSGNQLTITDSDTTLIVTLASVNKQSAVLGINDSETGTDSTGMIVSATIDMDINLSRDENGFTSNTINQRVGKTTWFNKVKLMNSIK